MADAGFRSLDRISTVGGGRTGRTTASVIRPDSRACLHPRPSPALFRAPAAIALLLALVGGAVLPSSAGGADRPRVGLALSGGGARGVAHIGVIQALEEAGIPVDVVAGTSMGSIVAGFYAAGYSGEEMERLVRELDWPALLRSEPEPNIGMAGAAGAGTPLLQLEFRSGRIILPYGIIDTQRIYETLYRRTAAADYAAGADFDSLVVPYRSVAVDAVSGEVLRLDSGSLAQAMRGSMAMPPAFTPANMNGRILIDGGVLDVLPTDVVRSLGADVVIGVEAAEFTSLGESRPEGMISLTLRATDFMIRQLAHRNEGLADVLVVPDLESHSSFDFDGLEDLIARGRAAARAKMETIRALVGRGAPAPHRRLDRQRLERSIVDRVEVEGAKRTPAPAVLRRFPLRAGERFDLERSIRGMRNLVSTGLFESVWLELAPLPGERTAVTIHVLERVDRSLLLGANYRSEEGLTAFARFVLDGTLGRESRLVPRLVVGGNRTEAGIEAVRGTSWPLLPLLLASLDYRDRRRFLYAGGGDLETPVRIETAASSLSLRSTSARSVALEAGVRLEGVRIGRDRTGEPQGRHTDLLGYGTAELDTRNRRALADRGGRARLSLIRDLHRFTGPVDDETRAEAEAEAILRLPLAQRLVLRGRAGISWGVLPLDVLFRVGGPREVPGLHRKELWGPDALALSATWRRPFLDPWNLEVSWGAGRVFPSRRAFGLGDPIVGAGIGVSGLTPVGPVSLSLGWAEGGRRQLDLSIGYDI